MFNLQTHCVWTTHNVKWIKCTTEKDKIDGIKPETTILIDLDVEKVPIVETVPENNDMDENDPINHGRPADADNKVDDSNPSTTMMEETDDIDPRVLCQMKNLGGWFNPSAEWYVAQAQPTRNNEESENHEDESDANMDEDTSRVEREVQTAMLPNAPSDFAFYTAAEAVKKHKLENGNEQQFFEPSTFWEAYDHPDPVQQKKWHKATGGLV